MGRIGSGKYYEVKAKETQLVDAFLAGAISREEFAERNAGIVDFWNSVGGFFDSLDELAHALRVEGRVAEPDVNRTIQHEADHTQVLLQHGIKPIYSVVLYGDSPHEQRVVCSTRYNYPADWTIDQIRQVEQEVLSRPEEPGPSDKSKLETLNVSRQTAAEREYAD